MKMSRFGHPRFSEFSEIAESGIFTLHPGLGVIFIRSDGWVKRLAKADGDTLNIVCDKWQDAVDIQKELRRIELNFDVWMDEALSRFEPPEPCARDIRHELRLYQFTIRDAIAYEAALDFNFIGPEDWQSIPVIRLREVDGRFEFFHMDWTI